VAQAKRRTSRARRATTPAKPAAPTPIAPPVGGRLWVLNVPFGARSIAAEHGARYDTARRSYVYAGTALPDGLLAFTPPLFSWEQWQQHVINGEPQPSFDGDGSVTLRAHQRTAVEAVVAARASGRVGFLVADETGLGKTYQAIAAVRQMQGVEHVLVVCPLSVRATWRKSLQTFGTGGQRWCVQNIDGMRKLVDIPKSAAAAKKQKTKNKHIAEKGQPLERWDVVIYDESAAYRNPSSQRSTLARRLGADAFRIWMSATAGQTPLELSYLAPVLAQVTGREVRDLEQFAGWCTEVGIAVTQGEYGRWEWEPNPADLTLIRQMLFEENPAGIRAGIRRRPTDIAGWPEQQRISVPIELDPEGRQLYEELWTEFRRQMQLTAKGKDPAGMLAAITRFRQKASLLRVDGVAGLIEELVDDGYRVAVSVSWLESMQQLGLDLNVGTIATMHGGQTESEREQQRVMFQRGEADVILFTPTEGFSLHASEDGADGRPRATVIHDVRWTAIESRQIEGRCHRAGERADVYYTYAEDTIEEFVLRRALQRVISMGEMQGDDTSEVADMLAAINDFSLTP
jgi:hypothetical protein